MSDQKTPLGSRPTRAEDPGRAAEIRRLSASAAGEKVRLNVNVPADLYARYKATTERRGFSVTMAVVQHIHDYLEAYE